MNRLHDRWFLRFLSLHKNLLRITSQMLISTFGMDVHQATTVVAVIDAEGKIVLQTIVATAAAPIRRLIDSISGPVHITLEETTQAEWLYELLQGFVAEVVVCDPRRNRLLSEGS